MRVTGKYDTWESETYVIVLSPRDLNQLNLFITRLAPDAPQWDCLQKRFLDMFAETEETEFGFQKLTTNDY